MSSKVLIFKHADIVGLKLNLRLICLVLNHVI